MQSTRPRVSESLDFGSVERRLKGDTRLHREPDPHRKGDTVVHTRTLPCAIDRYTARGEISSRMAEAARRFEAQWSNAQQVPARLTARYREKIGDGGANSSADSIGTRQVAARAAWTNAIRSVGKHLSPVLIDCVCLGGSARDWAQRTGRHPASGIEILRIALDMLADHYGKMHQNGANIP